MQVLHVSENDLLKDLRDVLKCIETGGEVVIERDAQPFAVIRPAVSRRWKTSERLALIDPNSPGRMDADFARDVREAMDSIREPWETPDWD